MRQIINPPQSYCSGFLDAQNLVSISNSRFTQHGNSPGKNTILQIERYITAVHILKKTGLKRLTIGTTESYYPINFRDADQQFKGYAIDMCNALGIYFGIGVEYEGYSNISHMIKGLQKNEVNLIISSIAINPARRLIMDFSIPYFINSINIAVSNEYKDINNWRDLDQPHISIAVSHGSTHDNMVEKVFPKANIQRCNGLGEAGQALLIGQVDAIITDNVWINHFVQQNTNKASGLKNFMGKTLPVGIAINKGQKTLLDAINIFVSQYNGSAFKAANHKRWLAGEVE